MALEIQQLDVYGSRLPEFSREIPNEEQISLLADQVVANQRNVLLIAEDFGLDTNILALLQQRFLVGPFVSPAPLSTTFAGNVDNFRSSVRIGQQLVQQLRQLGIKAEQALVVPIAWTEVPKSGIDAMDCLVLPRNKEENRRESLVGKLQPKQPYSLANFDPKALGKIKDPFLIFLDRYPELKKRGSNASIIRDALTQDLQAASKNGQVLSYLEFAQNLNAQIARRAIPSASFPVINVDTNYYGLFLKRGISNMSRFTRQLDALGFFQDNPGFVKTIIKDKVEVLKLEEITDKDIVLRFGADYSEPNSTITFSALRTAGRPITCCKELSYLICFSNIVPVLYGSQNSGDYYYPYAVAKARVESLGFEPTMYRIQPQIPSGYNEISTVFDFYRELLLEEANYGKP